MQLAMLAVMVVMAVVAAVKGAAHIRSIRDTDVREVPILGRLYRHRSLVCFNVEEQIARRDFISCCRNGNEVTR